MVVDKELPPVDLETALHLRTRELMATRHQLDRVLGLAGGVEGDFRVAALKAQIALLQETLVTVEKESDFLKREAIENRKLMANVDAFVKIIELAKNQILLDREKINNSRSRMAELEKNLREARNEVNKLTTRVAYLKSRLPKNRIKQWLARIGIHLNG